MTKPTKYKDPLPKKSKKKSASSYTQLQTCNSKPVYDFISAMGPNTHLQYTQKKNATSSRQDQRDDRFSFYI